MSRLYDEFAQFYNAERCQWAPENPRRAFNFAVKRVYPAFRGRLSEEQLLAAMYATLGFRGAVPPGLFQTFDPEKYTRRRGLHDHFVSLFGKKLRGHLTRLLRRTTDAGREGDATKYTSNPDLGLLRGGREPVSAAPPVTLSDGLAVLDPRERGVIHLTYWADLSRRKVGALLGLDHKTVGRVHDAAVQKLRRRTGLSNLWPRDGFVPQNGLLVGISR